MVQPSCSTSLWNLCVSFLHKNLIIPHLPHQLHTYWSSVPETLTKLTSCPKFLGHIIHQIWVDWCYAGHYISQLFQQLIVSSQEFFTFGGFSSCCLIFPVSHFQLSILKLLLCTFPWNFEPIFQGGIFRLSLPVLACCLHQLHFSTVMQLYSH